jgi:hypothetical protein
MNKKIVTVPLVTGVLGGLLLAEMHDKGKPHTSWVSVSATATSNVAMVDGPGPSVYVPVVENFVPVEVKLPSDHLVVQPATLPKA